MIAEYQAHYEQVIPHLPGATIPWIKQQRDQALAHFLKKGFPTTHDENWRYTPLSSFTRLTFTHSMPQVATVLSAENQAQLAKNTLLGKLTDVIEVIFVDGKWHSSSSHSPNLQSIAEVMHQNPDGLLTFAPQLRDDNTTANAFTQLNSALMQEGIFLHLPENKNLRLHVIYFSTQPSAPTACYWRNIIVLQKNAHATVIERYLGETNACYVTNTVTQAQLGEKSTLTHYKLQNESQQAFHFGTLYVDQNQPNSEFSGHVISCGGLLSRSDTHIQLNAPMTHCLLNGLYQVSGHQHVDHHTSIAHQKPHGTSRQYYKGILDEKARGVFNGIVYVCPHAQKTDSIQSNQNLLLSAEAQVDTKPQLEILADDVRCVHGATVGQLNEDALFYLRSRGLDEAMARHLLMDAFFSEVLARFPDATLREQVKSCL